MKRVWFILFQINVCTYKSITSMPTNNFLPCHLKQYKMWVDTTIAPVSQWCRVLYYTKLTTSCLTTSPCPCLKPAHLSHIRSSPWKCAGYEVVKKEADLCTISSVVTFVVDPCWPTWRQTPTFCPNVIRLSRSRGGGVSHVIHSSHTQAGLKDLILKRVT